tara:strand:+ start:1070 stop:1594 length:525 start_codon:yes stop_codon:yes gene_type:complete
MKQLTPSLLVQFIVTILFSPFVLLTEKITEKHFDMETLTTNPISILLWIIVLVLWGFLFKRIWSRLKKYIQVKHEFVKTLVDINTAQISYTNALSFQYKKNVGDYFLRLQNELAEGKKINQNSLLFDLSNDIDKNTEKEKDAIKNLAERLNIFKSKSIQDVLEYIEAEKTLKNK